MEEKNSFHVLRQFLKRGLFKGIKNHIPMCQMRNTQIQIHKYTKTGYDKVPETLNMWYIFEKAIVQGCLLTQKF